MNVRKMKFISYIYISLEVFSINKSQLKLKYSEFIIILEVLPFLFCCQAEQPPFHYQPVKYMRRCKLHVQVNAASCHSNFVVHEVMNFLANLKIHHRDCSANVNIKLYGRLFLSML